MPSSPTPTSVIFFGTPQFAATTLRALVDHGYRVVAVVTQPDRASGRGGRTTASPVKRLAVELGLPVVQPDRGRDLAALLAAYPADVGVVFAFGAIIPPAVLKLIAHGIINIHSSLLPKHRGPSPVASAILSGEPVTGVTLIRLDAEVDHGPILAQRMVPIEPNETADRLHDRLAQAGTELLLEVLPRWLAGQIKSVPQDHAAATFTASLDRSTGLVDWHQPAEVIVRRFRALYPWPGSYSHAAGLRLKCISLRVADSARPLAPGQVAVADRKVFVGTGRGTIQLQVIQLEGKRAAPAFEVINGHPRLAMATLS